MKLWTKLRALWRKPDLERVMDEEMQGHLDELTARKVATGMSPEDARYAALRHFGNMTHLKEQTRETWGILWAENLWRDLRFSVRSLRRSLVFSLAVIATLALCIWANTAVLSVLYGLVLKPLPFRDAGQIVDVYSMRPKAGQMHQRMGVAQYLDYKAQADLFADVSLWAGWMFNIGEDAGTARYVGMRITPEYFSVLGVQPLMGRFFTAEECVPGRDAVVVLTQTFWEKQFRGDKDIIGKEVRLTGRVYTVVGVLPRSFEEVSVAPVLMKPLEWSPDAAKPQARFAGAGDMSARIKPGVAHGAALAQLQVLEQRYRETVAEPAMREYLTSGGHQMGLAQLRAQQTEPIKNGLLLLQGGAFFCVTVGLRQRGKPDARAGQHATRGVCRAAGAGCESRRARAAVAHRGSVTGVDWRCLGTGASRSEFAPDQHVCRYHRLRDTTGQARCGDARSNVASLNSGGAVDRVAPGVAGLAIRRFAKRHTKRNARRLSRRWNSGDEWGAGDHAGGACTDVAGRGWVAHAQFRESNGNQAGV